MTPSPSATSPIARSTRRAASRRRGTSRPARGRRRRRARTASGRPRARRRPPAAARRSRSAAVAMSTATPLARATWPTSASSPSETSIIAVAPARGGLGPGAVRRLGALVGLDERARRAEAPRQHGEAGRRPSPAVRRSPRRRPARAPERRTGSPRRAPERGDRRPSPGRRWSGPRRPREAPTSAPPRRCPSRQLQRPLRPAGRPVRARPDGQRGRAAAHRVDVGQVLRRPPCGRCRARRPSRGGSAGCRRAGRWRRPRGRPGTATTAASSPGPSSTCSPCGNRAASARDQSRTRRRPPVSRRPEPGGDQSWRAIQPQPPATVFRRGHRRTVG